MQRRGRSGSRWNGPRLRHRVHGDGAADHGLVPFARKSVQGLRDLDRLVEGHPRQFGCKCMDAGGGDAAAPGHRLGGVIVGEVALREQLEHRPMLMPARR